MPVNLLQFFYDLGLLLFFVLCAIYIVIFLIHLKMPKELISTYFRSPYFKTAELAMFSGFPMGYIRTIMFMRVLGFPQSGKKRGLTEAYKLAPGWFCLTSRIVVSAFVVTFGLLLIILLVFFVESLVFGEQ